SSGRELVSLPPPPPPLPGIGGFRHVPGTRKRKLRGQDLNLRPSGYEGDCTVRAVRRSMKSTSPLREPRVLYRLDKIWSKSVERRSEERRVGKECRSRWAQYQ